jgi:starch-binding outer membrane protein, SusD/RagB family
MKKYFIFLSIAFLFANSSCKKSYLDLEPETVYTYYNFPENEAQAEQAVVGMYRQLMPIYNSYMWTFGEMLSDNTSFRYNASDRGGLETERLDEFVANATEGTIGNAYRDFYEGITRSHFVLESLPNIVYASDSLKNIRVGEAKFFRAFHYFNLVRLYGDVPIIKKVLKTVEEQGPANYPRRPAQDVYNEMIIPDALEAIGNLPTTVPNNQRGRLTKAAAYMLLGKVYLTLKRYPEALANFDAVTGHSLNPSYVANFNPATKNGVESIFEIQVLPLPTSAGGYFFSFMSQWAPWGTGTTFWAGNSNSRGGLNQPTRDLIRGYEPGDIRRAVTIAGALITFNGSTDSVYCFRKFTYSNAANAAVNEAQWPVYRFAETILSRAECLNEISFPNATAFTLLNQIRTRAGLPNKTQNNPNPALAINSQVDFRLAIEQERKVEFAAEAHRWFDLVRTGRATAVMTAHGSVEKSIKPTITDPAAYQNIKLLIGLPFREVNEFGYPQTPGW